MQSILASSQLFHTLILDFILVLLILSFSDCFNSIMSITDKFSKTVTFVPEKKTWEDKKWAVILLLQLDLVDWDLSFIIISDQNIQFVERLWRVIFKHLKVDLLYSTVYYSQTDRVSEIINQQTEIVLHYYLITLSNLTDWSVILLCLQTAANNVYKTSIQQSSNKILYDFKSNEVIDLLQFLYFITAVSSPAIEAHSVAIESDLLSQLNEWALLLSTLTELQSIQWNELWAAQQKDLLAIISSYWSSLIDAQDVIA